MNFNIKKNQKSKLLFIFFTPIIFLFGIFSFAVHQNYISQISYLDEKLQEASHSNILPKNVKKTDWENLSMKDLDLKLLSEGKPIIGNSNDPLYALTPSEINTIYNKEFGDNNNENLFLLSSRNEVERLTNLPYISQEQFKSTQNEIILDSFWFLILLFLGILFIVAALSFFLMKLTLNPIEQSIEKQNQFIANASHELKTPLTLIKSEADVLLMQIQNKQTVSKKEIFEFLTNITTDTKNLNILIDKLLTFEQQEVKNIINTQGSINTNISQYITAISQRIFETYKSNKILNIDITENIYKNISESDITQIITILTDNACKYSQNTSTITISLNINSHNKITLAVKNTDSFISPSDTPYVFDRFFRASHHQNKTGHGLGLSLLKEIIEKNNGEVFVYSNETEKYTQFTIIL